MVVLTVSLALAGTRDGSKRIYSSGEVSKSGCHANNGFSKVQSLLTSS